VSDPDDFENVPGHGIRATVGDSEVLVGNRKFLRDNGIDPSPAQETMERRERGEDGDARRPRARWHGRGRTPVSVWSLTPTRSKKARRTL